MKEPLGLEWFDYGAAPDQVDQVAHNVSPGPRCHPLITALPSPARSYWEEVIDLSNDPRFLSGVIPSGDVIVTAGSTAAFYQCLADGGALDGTRVFERETIARAVADDSGGGVSFDRMIEMPSATKTRGSCTEPTPSASTGGTIHGRSGTSACRTRSPGPTPTASSWWHLLTTGKPILGTHLLALPRVISEIHRSFPATTSASA